MRRILRSIRMLSGLVALGAASQVRPRDRLVGGAIAASDLLVGRLSALGINALAIDTTITLVSLGPRGPEIFHELCGGGPESENADRVGWLLVDAGIPGEADAVVSALEALLPRFPELHRDFRKESAS